MTIPTPWIVLAIAFSILFAVIAFAGEREEEMQPRESQYVMLAGVN